MNEQCGCKIIVFCKIQGVMYNIDQVVYVMLFVKASFLKHALYKIVVYFTQRAGAPHAVRWSKSIFLLLKQLFELFVLKRTLYDQKLRSKRGSTSV